MTQAEMQQFIDILDSHMRPVVDDLCRKFDILIEMQKQAALDLKDRLDKASSL